MHSVFLQKYREILVEYESGEITRLFDGLKNTLGGRPVVLYGAGVLGRSILELCVERGIDVACFCDRRAMNALDGVPVINPQALKYHFADATVVVCSYTYNGEIISNLIELGFITERIIPCPTTFSQFVSAREFRHYLDGYRWAYDMFKDEISKNTIIDRIRMYLCETPMMVNTPCDQYYEDGFITLGKHEVFVDGGAFDGDSAIAFAEKASLYCDEHTRIYAFEPDANNYTCAVERTSKYKYPYIDVIPKGLWSGEAELTFSGHDARTSSGASIMLGQGGVMSYISVTSLDTFFSGKPDTELPTFIKLDIEGSEKEALIGASDIIKRVKPKLAICAYHKPADIYELPQTILAMRNDYKFALRQHMAGCYETVLYCV